MSAGTLPPDERRLAVGASIQDTRGDKIASACIYTALGLFCLAVLYPLIYVLSASVSNTKKVASGQVWLWPVGFTRSLSRKSWERYIGLSWLQLMFFWEFQVASNP